MRITRLGQHVLFIVVQQLFLNIPNIAIYCLPDDVCRK